MADLPTITHSYLGQKQMFYERLRGQSEYKREGAYATDFYRVVRGGQHAEVRWRNGDIANSTNVAQLWYRVADLEPVCKEAILSPHAGVVMTFAPVRFVRLKQWAPARSI